MAKHALPSSPCLSHDNMMQEVMFMFLRGAFWVFSQVGLKGRERDEQLFFLKIVFLMVWSVAV